MKYTAILEFKAVYDRVPRDKLLCLTKSKLPDQVHKIITLAPHQYRYAPTEIIQPQVETSQEA